MKRVRSKVSLMSNRSVAWALALTGLAGIAPTLADEKSSPSESMLRYAAPDKIPTFSHQYEQYFLAWESLNRASEEALNAVHAIQLATASDIDDTKNAMTQTIPNSEVLALIPWKFANCQVYKSFLDPETDELTLEIRDFRHSAPFGDITITLEKNSVTAQGGVLHAEPEKIKTPATTLGSAKFYLGLDHSKTMTALYASFDLKDSRDIDHYDQYKRVECRPVDYWNAHGYRVIGLRPW